MQNPKKSKLFKIYHLGFFQKPRFTRSFNQLVDRWKRNQPRKYFTQSFNLRTKTL